MKIRRAELLASCGRRSQLPDTDRPEFAFLGRSNVGKSSLLNALVRRKSLARTSSTPGKTRLVHFYDVDTDAGAPLFVDLPGYGFARVPKSERDAWRRLVEGYLDGRPQLRAAILLQDIRRDWSEDEALLVDWLAERDTDVIVALTKADKLKPMQRKKRVAELVRQIGRKGMSVVVTSAQSKLGVDGLWGEVRGRM